MREEDRVRIEEEEMVRERARQILADERQRREREQQSKVKKTWAFLQTPLVIWFLSSVLVALVAFGYKQYQTKQTADRQHKETISNMNSEVATRLRGLNVLIDRELAHMTNAAGLPFWINAALTRSPEKLQNANLPVINVYPKYNSFSVIALAVSLKAMTSGKQKTQVGSGVDLLTDLSDKADELHHKILDAEPSDFNSSPYRQWEKQTAEEVRTFLMQVRDTLRNTSLPEEWRA
jgi:hypothetical protein